jgi:hypothetical protein
MAIDAAPVVLGGIALPDTIFQTQSFAILAAFVAINTIIYAALAVAKILPKVYPRDWFRGPNRRSEIRSIHPDGR